MNAGKPRKSAPRKASKPTLEQRVQQLEELANFHNSAIVGLQTTVSINPIPAIAECMRRLDALESRDRLRDKSHDEPVSNANEVIGLYPPTTPVRHEWKRRSPEEAHQRKWWQFWRRT